MPAAEEKNSVGWLGRFKDALKRTRDSLAGVEALAAARRPIDRELWEELEEILIGADFGVATTEKIVAGLKEAAHQEMWTTSDRVIARFKRDVAHFMTLPDRKSVV